MVKDSAEERIMQIGKKKLVLDHLIVQKMDDDADSPGENVESILTYGAQALFDANQAAKEIQCKYPASKCQDAAHIPVDSDADIDQLIEKTEKEGDGSDAPKDGAAFSFAKVWSAEKDQLEDVPDEDQVDSWANTLTKINEEREKERQQEIAVSGRGSRRKAADMAKAKMVFAADGSISKIPGGSQSDASVYSAQAGSGDDGQSEGPSSEGEPEDEDFQMAIDDPTKEKKQRRRRKPKLQDIDVPNVANGAVIGGVAMRVLQRPQSPAEPVLECGLCGRNHGVKECLMTDNSQNLAEYRLMLIMHADDEPWEERSAAIRAIDEILNSRGALHLIQGQPLHPVKKVTNVPPTNRPKETTELVAQHYREKQAQQQARAQQQQQAQAGPSGLQQQQQPRYQETRTGNAVVRDYSMPAQVQRVGNGIVVNAPASGSGSKRPAMVMPTANAKAGASSGSMGPPTMTPSGTLKAAARAGTERCVVCSASSGHSLKACPVVLEGPKR